MYINVMLTAISCQEIAQRKGPNYKYIFASVNFGLLLPYFYEPVKTAPLTDVTFY